MTENTTARQIVLPVDWREQIANEVPSAYLRCTIALIESWTKDASTLPVRVQHLVSQDIGKVLAWHSEGYTADFGSGPEYVKALDVRPIEES